MVQRHSCRQAHDQVKWAWQHQHQHRRHRQGSEGCPAMSAYEANTTGQLKCADQQCQQRDDQHQRGAKRDRVVKPLFPGGVQLRLEQQEETIAAQGQRKYKLNSGDQGAGHLLRITGASREAK